MGRQIVTYIRQIVAKYSAKSNKYSAKCNKNSAITSITTCLQTGYFNHVVYPSIEKTYFHVYLYLFSCIFLLISTYFYLFLHIYCYFLHVEHYIYYYLPRVLPASARSPGLS